MKEMTIEEIKQCELNMLVWFDKICKERHLTYWLAYGTLIGAIRHKGFIPWDDDIDIMMPRKDYLLLSSINMLSSRYRLLTPQNTSNYPYPMNKIVDTYTIKKESIRKKFQVTGVDIDIFPVDNYPNDVEDANNLSIEINKNQSIIFNLITDYGKGRTVIRTILRNIRILYWHFLNDLGIMPISKYVLNIDKLSQSYNSLNTEYMGNYMMIVSSKYHMNPKSVFASSIEVEFEGHKFPAPIGYDKCLRKAYGDYLCFPPQEERVTHHSYKAYWK